MKKQLLFLLFGATVFSGYSQKVVWEQTIGGEHSEYLFDMVPTVDYGFLLAGSSLSDKTGSKKDNGQGSLDYFLWKMDKNGEEEWQWSFGGEGQDILKSIAMTSRSEEHTSELQSRPHLVCRLLLEKKKKKRKKN